MFDKLPSLRGFHPEWFTGGAATSCLPLLYDLVALTRPKTVCTLWYGDGQIHFACCQAAREKGLETRCLAWRREAGEKENADEAWVRGIESGEERYGEASALIAGTEADFTATLAGRKIDLLVLDQIDSGAELGAVLRRCESALSPGALVLFHGIALDRPDAPGPSWEKWASGRRALSFRHGIGLGVAEAARVDGARDALYDWLFQARARGLEEYYVVAAERMEAQCRLLEAEREIASLQARQVWLDSIVTERRGAQSILDDQGRMIAILGPRAEAWQRDREALQRDRAKAQLVMDAQFEQLQQLETNRDKYKRQANERKEILRVAKQACRKKGRCFQLPRERAEKERRPLSERILREIKRVPRNLLGRKPAPPPAREKAGPAPPSERER